MAKEVFDYFFVIIYGRLDAVYLTSPDKFFYEVIEPSFFDTARVTYAKNIYKMWNVYNAKIFDIKYNYVI
jgi:hypothetical protein